MKNLLVCITIAGMVGISACSDFLDIRPVGAVDETALLNKEGIDFATVAMYSTLYNNGAFEGNLTNYQYGDVLAGDANKGSSFSDQPNFTNLELYQITTDNAYLQRKWEDVYQGIHRANTLISMTNKIKEQLIPVSGELKDYYTETIAQARFFRGFWHFEGMRVFGAAIPYIGDEAYATGIDPNVSNVDESGNYIYIWDKVIEDLQYAYDNLPSNWLKTGNFGQTNKWAAAAYIAKVKMYQSSPYNGTNGSVNKWIEVKMMLEEIMGHGEDAKGTRYRLADSYEELVIAGSSDWTGESVFDIQATIQSTQTTTNSIVGSGNIAPPSALSVGGWGFYQPTFDMANAHIVNENGLPYLDREYRNMPALTQLSNDNIPTTDLKVYTDPRLDVTMGRFNVPYYDWSIPNRTEGWIRDVSNGGVYINKKYQPRKMDKGSLSVSTSASSTAKNIHLIRYADVLLWYAEVLIETGEHMNAREFVNKVRTRAANGFIKAVDPETMEETESEFVLEDLINGTTQSNTAANYRIGLYPESQFATKDGATAALRYERRMELGLEGHRWFDLCRWGIAQEEITGFLEFEKTHLTKYSRAKYDSKWVTLPIPNNEIITKEGALVQNINWK